MLNKTTFFFLLVGLFLSSCSRKFLYVDAKKLKTETQTTSNPSYDSIKVYTRYAGDAFDFLIFELDISNNTEDTIYVSHQDIFIELLDRGNSERNTILVAEDKDRIIEGLGIEQRRIDRSKKRNTIWNVVNVGLGLTSLALSSGNATEAIIYSAESATFILEDRRYFNALKGDLDDKIEYVEDWVLQDDYVAPGERYSWDILFERTLEDTDAELHITLGTKDHFVFPYELFVNEGRY